MKLTDKNTLRQLQGDMVLVVIDGEEFLYTIVHFINGENHSLELSDRTKKPKDRGENVPITQAILDNLVPVKHEKAKWKLVL